MTLLERIDPLYILCSMWGPKSQYLQDSLREVYGEEDGKRCLSALEDLLVSSTNKSLGAKHIVDESDYNVPCLIAYADSLVPAGSSAHATPKKKKTEHSSGTKTPLQHLRRFMSSPVDVVGVPTKPSSVFRRIHILPFYPWDTDRGFSVKDYRKVDSRNGTWDDVRGLVKDGIGLMFDFVANHASVENPLVQGV